MLDTISDVLLDLGTTRIFGECDLGSAGLVSGWAEPEEGHTWNDGVEAVFQVFATRPASRCRISFEGEPFLSRACRHQDVALYVNGYHLASWRLNEARTYSLEAVIEPEQLFVRGNRVVARCVWCLPDSTRPADAGDGSDTRELGFCFRSVTITELD